ncbi:MAG: hypothetical protein HY741_08185 [Chloroflexi bacterium]|nr:hypothetical protein [Chloroflexota bacterium]
MSEIQTKYLIEQDGKRLPVLAMNSKQGKGFSIIQGPYLPSPIKSIFEKHDPPSTADVNEHPATLYRNCCGSLWLVFEINGTQIKVGGSSDVSELITFAESLAPAK